MHRLAAVIVLGTVCLGTGAAEADRFELAGGGVIEGDLVERVGDGPYVIRTRWGATVEIPHRELVRIVEQDPAAVAYLRRSRRAPDTAEAHRQLAVWCKEHGLLEEREHHLRRLIQLAPDDESARLALGYQDHGGRWMTREEIMEARGMIYYQGDYRTSQEIALLERAKQQKEAEIHWHGEIKRLQSWLEHRRPERVAQAKDELMAIDDPHAAPALVAWLSEEQDEYTRRLLLDVLDPLDHPAAIQTLVQLSIYDPNPDFRLLCLDYLTRDGTRPPLRPYVEALANKDNAIVNQAAGALGKIGDPEAISPLIDALVTRHKYVVGAGNPGQLNAGFGSGGGGFSVGGNGPKVVRRNHENLTVLRALGELTAGQDFGYDESAWRRWFVNTQKVRFTSSRRDQ